MKDKEMIEEMAKDCCLVCAELYGDCNCKKDKCPSVKLESKRLIENGWVKLPKDSVVYQDGKIYYNGKHIGYIEFSFYEDIKALGFGNFEIIDKRKGYGTIVIKNIIRKYKDKYNLIYCFVDKDNIGAIEFYEKVGKVCFDITNDKGQYQVILHGKEASVVLSKEELEEKYEPSEKFMAVARELEDLKQNLEDKVVLSREQFKILCEDKVEITHLSIDEEFKKECEYEIKQAVKETAEKIFQEINHLIVKDKTTPIWIKEKLIELAKQYGVEIKEN